MTPRGLSSSTTQLRKTCRLSPTRFARGARRVGSGNFTPSPSQNSGLEPLDSSGSCHPMRAAALRQNRRVPPVASWPIMVPTWIACPLRSRDITPLLRYYQAVRPSASHPYSRPRGSIHLWLLRFSSMPRFSCSMFFSTRQWFAFVPLPRRHLTRISSGPFPSPLTTTPLRGAAAEGGLSPAPASRFEGLPSSAV